ncbi:MAG: sugar ABC transporter permease [Chloroflexota bacterium]
MKQQTFFAFAAPSITIMTLLMVIPLGMAIWLGMNLVTFRNINDPQFVGLQNYIEVLTDPQFWQSFRFTILYMVLVVPAWIIIGFCMALVLDQVSGFVRGVYLSIFLLPFIIVPIVGTVMFKQLFEASGPLRYLYEVVLDERFRYNENIVKSLIVIFGVWYVTPFSLVVYFAGIQTLPQELLEASSIDGATSIQKIRHIVIPHVSSLTLFILLFSIMDAYRVFDSVFVMTENLNPIYRANTMMTYTFQTAIANQRLGVGNAMAIITVLGIMIVLIPNNNFS